jgi:tRNA(adenine34) deaminase
MTGHRDEHYSAWMLAAIDDARRASETGDVPVAALVLGADGTPIGRGSN